MIEQSTNFYASNLELGSVPPFFLHQLGRSRWQIDADPLSDHHQPGQSSNSLLCTKAMRQALVGLNHDSGFSLYSYPGLLPPASAQPLPPIHGSASATWLGGFGISSWCRPPASTPPDRCAWFHRRGANSHSRLLLRALLTRAYTGILRPAYHTVSLRSFSTPPRLQNSPNTLTRLKPFLMNINLPLTNGFAKPLVVRYSCLTAMRRYGIVCWFLVSVQC